MVTGMEALLRLTGPDNTYIPPVDFIPVLEESGLIVPVGEWVLHTACTQLKAGHAMGFTELHIAVNLSVRQFCQPNLRERIEAILIRTGLDPHFLELEITESLLMDNMESAIRVLKELHALGVRISIDDFGTGFSSLGYLNRLPIHSLKIDRSFIRDIPFESDAASIAQTIIILAHTLRLTVTAEGVETMGQRDFLKAHDCDSMQGYLLSRRLPRDKIPEFLREMSLHPIGERADRNWLTSQCNCISRFQSLLTDLQRP